MTSTAKVQRRLHTAQRQANPRARTVGRALARLHGEAWKPTYEPSSPYAMFLSKKTKARKARKTTKRSK